MLDAVIDEESPAAFIVGEAGLDDSPWSDPMVKAALEEGRDPSDIYLIDCPGCGVAGYYNQGWHFSCRICDAGWTCIADDEYPPLSGRYIVLGEEYALSDYEELQPEDVP